MRQGEGIMRKGLTKRSWRPWLVVLLSLLWVCQAQASTLPPKVIVKLIVTNAQGTVVATMTRQGQVTYTAAYRPYGQQVKGTPQAGPGYTGHVNDPDTGLVYMQQRYYDPMGRFLSPDPVGPTPGNIYSFNRYAYANNNPLRFTDPSGMCSKHQTEHIDEDDSASEKLCARAERTRRGDAGGIAQSTTAMSALTLALTGLQDTAVAGGLGFVGALGVGVELMAFPIQAASDQTVTGWALAQSRRAVNSWKPRRGELLYRIWGGGSKIYGASWTPVNPLALRMAGVNVRDFAGLPNENLGNHLIMAQLINPAAVVRIRYAMPLDGNRGGLVEYVIPNASVNVEPIDSILVRPSF